MSFDEWREDRSEVASGDAHVGREDGAWREADRQLRRIAKRRAGLDAEEARWLLAAQRAEVHARLGCATFAEYVERVLGYGPRVCADRLRVATALEALPSTRAALAAGAVSYSAVRELARVATPATERAWLDAARGKTVREVEELVAGHRPGDGPDDRTDADLRPRVLRFEVSPETYALFRDAERRLAAHAGRIVDDDEVIDAMCRAVLAPSDDDGEANVPPYQIALTVCAECDRAWQDGGGRPIEVGPDVIAMARCDAQTIGRVDGNTRVRASRTIPPALRRQVLRRDHGRCVVPGCRASRFIAVHHLHERGRGGPNEARNLVSLCNGHHVSLHLGQLSITGEPGHRAFWNPDGSRWGTPPPAPPPPPPPAIADEVRAALRTLGFKPAEASAAVDHALAQVDAGASIDELLRAALRACRAPE